MKVLKALVMGVPVSTNEIGIEGINAKNKRDYLFCTSPQEYADTIRKIVEGKLDTSTISQNAVNFISKTFDFHKLYKGYSDKLKNLCNK